MRPWFEKLVWVVTHVIGVGVIVVLIAAVRTAPDRIEAIEAVAFVVLALVGFNDFLRRGRRLTLYIVVLFLLVTILSVRDFHVK